MKLRLLFFYYMTSSTLTITHSNFTKFWQLLTRFSATFSDKHISMDQVLQLGDYCVHLTVNRLNLLILNSALKRLWVNPIKAETKWGKHKMADVTLYGSGTHHTFFLQNFFCDPFFQKTTPVGHWRQNCLSIAMLIFAHAQKLKFQNMHMKK